MLRELEVSLRSKDRLVGYGLDWVAQRVNEQLRDDPVGRGIEFLRRDLIDDLANATKALLRAEKVFIITGFFIPSAKTIETDGLSGSCFLAKALLSLQKEVWFLEDPHNEGIVRSGLSSLGIYPKEVNFRSDIPLEEYAQSLPISNHDVLVAVERPGKGLGNKYRTMRGAEIPAYPLDDIFVYEQKLHPGLLTISCADGLNEVGMGKLRRGIIGKDAAIQSVVPVDCLIIGGTADWSAYGLVTTLSILSGEDLFPKDYEQARFLEAIVKAGAVDGISGKAELTIDTLPLSRHQEKVSELKKLFVI